jgi:hypothetical protein
MPRTDDTPPSVLQVAHAMLFSAGLVSLLIAIFSAHALWYVIAGPCLAVSGGLILVGSRLTFDGPIGDVLRAALGASTVRRLNVRAVIWVFAGLLISVWGLERMRAERNDRPFKEPLAAHASAAPQYWHAI